MKLRVNRNFLKVMAGIAGVICLLISFFLLLHAWEVKESQVNLPETDRDSITWNGVKYLQRKDLDTILIMGLDKFEDTEESGKYLNHQQADFMVLLAVDRKTKTYSVLHLNRDTMTDISVLGERGERVGTVNEQLALSHTYGTGGKDSCRNSVEAVSNLLHGVKIDHFLSMTMDAVAILNDYAGGVTVEVLDDFSEIDPSLVQGEIITLKGPQALTYVRTRKNLEDSSNLHRMERQRQYLTALREQVESKRQKDPEFLAKALAKAADYLVSDVTVNQMSAISEKIDGYTFNGFRTLDGEAVKGDKYMEYYVDKDALMETVLELYFKPKEYF
ncbi:MAG: LCP family protein [Eubacteriales bacterium]|nr:LCP family protein [Eubacteriales bacterium]